MGDPEFARHRAELEAVLPAHVDRLTWDAKQIRRHQQEQLRRLVAAAIGGPPSTPGGSAGSIRTGSSSTIWPRCRR